MRFYISIETIIVERGLKESNTRIVSNCLWQKCVEYSKRVNLGKLLLSWESFSCKSICPEVKISRSATKLHESFLSSLPTSLLTFSFNSRVSINPASSVSCVSASFRPSVNTRTHDLSFTGLIKLASWSENQATRRSTIRKKRSRFITR